MQMLELQNKLTYLKSVFVPHNVNENVIENTFNECGQDKESAFVKLLSMESFNGLNLFSQQ